MPRLLQFSLRTVLVAVAAIGIICLGLLIAVRPYLSKRSTENYWIKVGAIGSCDQQGHLTRLYATSTFDRSSLQHVAGSRHLYLLVLNGTSVTDDDVRLLRNLPALRSLALNGTQVSDRSMAHIARSFPKLKYLYLKNTKVTDAGLSFIEQLKHLKHLDVRNAPATNGGVSQLEEAIGAIEILQ